MQWYYSANGQQQGPVSETELQNLSQAGTVGPETLVWREGLQNWTPYREIALGSANPIPAHVPALPGQAVAVGDLATCVECGGTFSKENMVTFQNVHICAACKPRYFQKLKEGVVPGAAGMWREKKRLVTLLNPVLPPRCVKCNAATDTPQKKRNLYWHSPVVYIALLINVIVYAIIAMIARKRTVAMVSLCPVHRAKRRNAIWGSWLMVLAGIGSIIAGIANNDISWMIIVGIVLFLGGLIYGLACGRLIYATKMTPEHVWLAGCGKDFLASFPEWTG